MSDGRDALGVVVLAGGAFTAIDAGGVVVGAFASLREASRSLPDRGAS